MPRPMSSTGWQTAHQISAESSAGGVGAGSATRRRRRGGCTSATSRSIILDAGSTENGGTDQVFRQAWRNPTILLCPISNAQRRPYRRRRQCEAYDRSYLGALRGRRSPVLRGERGRGVWYNLLSKVGLIGTWPGGLIPAPQLKTLIGTAPCNGHGCPLGPGWAMQDANAEMSGSKSSSARMRSARDGSMTTTAVRTD
jgi:hypothetical protein